MVKRDGANFIQSIQRYRGGATRAYDTSVCLGAPLQKKPLTKLPIYCSNDLM